MDGRVAGRFGALSKSRGRCGGLHFDLHFDDLIEDLPRVAGFGRFCSRENGARAAQEPCERPDEGMAHPIVTV